MFHQITFIYLVCNAGYYKDGDECVMCPENTVKSTEGDDTSCPTVCDGVTKVPNSGHSDCGKSRNNIQTATPLNKINYVQIMILFFLDCNAGHYKDGDDCIMCPGNTIKPTSGDDISCTASCEENGKVANTEHTACSMFNQFLM